MGEGIGSTEVSNSVVANVTDTTKLRKLKPLEATGERPTHSTMHGEVALNLKSRRKP